LEQFGKETVEKFYGEPVFDKKGHINKYKMEKGVISYLHLFGEEPGIFKPHLNYHIFEDRTKKLKIDYLESIRKYWLKKLQYFDESLTAVDVHYSFRTTSRKVMHSIKYMSRPWSAADLAAIDDEKLKKLLILDLSGFHYMRFIGAMANKKYKDEMDLSEIQKECESKVGEKLTMKFVGPFDFDAWMAAGRLEEIDDGLYRVKKKVLPKL
jgi:hypothetical protein